MAAACCVVVAWTPASVDSDWVRAEAAEALEANKLVPVFLAAVRPPLRFRHTQGMDLTGWNGRPAGAPFNRLVTHIEELAGVPATRAANTLRDPGYGPGDIDRGLGAAPTSAGAAPGPRRVAAEPRWP